MARAKFACEKFDSTISSNQLRVIEDHVQKNVPDLQSSDLFHVAMADHLDHESRFECRKGWAQRQVSVRKRSEV